MSARAYFGRPNSGFTPGGTHITVYLVPVFDGQLITFDVAAAAARGRWLPWNVLGYGQNPYEGASELADEWCGGQLSDLSLADVLSFPGVEGGWELAIVFRAELMAMPPGDDARTPAPLPRGQFDAIGPFDPVDLERWVARGKEAPAGGENLVF